MNREALLHQGIDFPLAGRITRGTQSHRHFSAYFRGIEKEYPGGFENVVHGEFTTSESCVLSSEDFYFCSKRDSLEKISDVFGNNTVIICFLRDPLTHVMSMYKESLKGRETAGLGKFIARHKSKIRKGGKFSYYSYQANLKVWQDFYHDVFILPYPVNADAPEMLDQFLQFAGLKMEREKLVVPGRSNVSMSDEAAITLMYVNRMWRDEIITDKQRNDCKQTILKRDEELKKLVADRVVREEIDAAGFIETFQENNRDLAGVIEYPDGMDSFSKIDFPMQLDICNNDLIDCLMSLG